MEMVEENYLIGLPIESLFSYAMTKRMLYVGLLALRKQFGLNYLYIVPSTLYGPRYHTDGRQMHFIFDLIRKILRGQLYDEKVTLWGDGNQLRELIHIDDFINVMLSLNENIQNDIVNIGSGEEFTIRYFAHLICDCVGYPFEKIYFDVNAYIGAKSKCLNINKLKGYLPDLQFKPLNIGIQETINWFLQNRERLLPE
jgi:GDP-L-fucose synthase